MITLIFLINYLVSTLISTKWNDDFVDIKANLRYEDWITWKYQPVNKKFLEKFYTEWDNNEIFLDFINCRPVYIRFEVDIVNKILAQFIEYSQLKNRIENIIWNNSNNNIEELDPAIMINLKEAIKEFKKRRKSKIEWFDKNIENFCLTLESDFEVFKNNILINAKEPAQFLAGIIEYNKYRKNKSHIIRTPILFDATCSGIQHLSALTTDTKLAALVNLLNFSGEDKPSDFYQYCIDKIVSEIKNSGLLDLRVLEKI
uniref:DNA-directed RNA polymerase n=1 Tax=Armillaria sinapina TaxID=64372 RepID=A0A4D6FEU7_9AGAR|nr:RNA polymerase [Armillaria sinapina]QCB16360.1 RNA polymerase [Armillaria sinapina]